MLSGESIWIFVMLWVTPSLSARESQPSEYDYVSFQPEMRRQYQSGRFYSRPAQCVDIPQDLALCHGVGYNKMVLPNLLDHETMVEVKYQASSWVPLLSKNCHPGTQVFLCSLFAPVCLDRPIYPCRWLCEAVRDGCEPVMQYFGFPWPEMLRCDQYPREDVCIAGTSPNATQAPRPRTLKVTVREVKKEGGDRKLVLRKKKALKRGPIHKKDWGDLVLYLKNGANCPCHQLEQLNGQFLVLGRKVKTQYILTAIHKWDKTNREFNRFMRKVKKSKCPKPHSVFM
ncbi:secreted frizzled-related 1 [Pelobates cultripes]|uniref:Secreted frizzled-related protein 1 n=1 Tax=Pelobates cultripes TaxID=61616 RepID=A0AAD1RQD8_PELCU|nr:secreted frizzled-related 1 [Pelobates cultripes]